jgi:hypothetical protein
MKFKYIFGLLALLGFASCIEEGKNAIEGFGGNYVRISGAGNDLNAVGFSARPGSTTLPMFTVQRDANSEANLNTAVEVQLALDPSMITAYNTANGTSFIDMPASLYSLKSLNVAFAPGEFAKKVTITVDPSTFDLSKAYAIGIKIASASNGFTIVESSKSGLFNILVKNDYDGIYKVTGTMVDYANATLTGYFPMNFHLVTSGAVTVDGYDPDVWHAPFVPIYSGTAVSGYGSFCPVFTFDPATNKITKVTNYYGQPAGNTRSAEIDPTGINKFNADDHSIDVKFFMKQPSAVPAAPNIRVAFDWHMEYIGPR